MKAVFRKERQFVYSINFETHLSDEQMFAGMRSLDWENAATNNFKNRYEINQIPNDNVVSEISQYLKSDSFKRTMIDLLYQDEEFFRFWQIDPNRMFNGTNAFASFVLDKPGYTTGRHLDNRCIVITGMYYLIDGDDPDQSTYFYSSMDGKDELRMLTGVNCGWLMGNLHTTWHRGFNRSNRDRYAILFGLTLPI